MTRWSSDDADRWWAHEQWFISGKEHAGEYHECPVCGAGYTVQHSGSASMGHELWCRDAITLIRETEAALRGHRETQLLIRQQARWT